MIDFKNTSFFKLKPMDISAAEKSVSAILVDSENIISAFQAVRDMVIFTNKRIIAINIQGITGTKKDYTSLPYSKVQAYSIETAGFFSDLDCELELWFSGLGKVRFEFRHDFDITSFNKILSNYIL